MPRGIYIHIPFCKSKCPYCDFYSFACTENQKDSYLNAVLFSLDKYSQNLHGDFDTIYFGGGTPSYFGAKRLCAIIEKINSSFSMKNPEITVECNPSSVSLEFFEQIQRGGANRISMGMQSAVTDERISLGRTSSRNEVENAVKMAKESGIENISLDLMLGVPNQTMKSLDESIDFLLSLDVQHISAYMLKIEEGTPFFKQQDSLEIADEDEVCDFYLHTIERLNERGFKQYEISNFSKVGFESRHNLKYWNCEEYLGIGPSAHGFIDGKRYFYPRDFSSFLNGDEPVLDGSGADEEEYIMLRLRLNEGILFKEFEEKFDESFLKNRQEKAETLSRQGLVNLTDEKISLTEKGFLLSNSIIGFLIED